jgi:hypothetical protein
MYFQAVVDARNNMLSPWFVKYAKSQGKTIDLETFKTALNAILDVQLGATLAAVSPLNSVRVWTVPLTVA